ncbi:hypothetical protein L596_026653 [Steinernema carpocapsae]|uniref:Uncharacterized protein n=1 Tax=Steinernema carpocapsae TaxID=34508 RepID=A0A4U5M252_STECR|nr:hypothetical protein L596_026653 [Steinernema carpocapsae]
MCLPTTVVALFERRFLDRHGKPKKRAYLATTVLTCLTVFALTIFQVFFWSGQLVHPGGELAIIGFFGAPLWFWLFGSVIALVWLVKQDINGNLYRKAGRKWQIILTNYLLCEIVLVLFNIAGFVTLLVFVEVKQPLVIAGCVCLQIILFVWHAIVYTYFAAYLHFLVSL